MFPPPLKTVFIKGSRGILIFVNEDELRNPAILLN
jgi:hypothetical protein